jgi:hypothetical protein
MAGTQQVLNIGVINQLRNAEKQLVEQIASEERSLQELHNKHESLQSTIQTFTGGPVKLSIASTRRGQTIKRVRPSGQLPLRGVRKGIRKASGTTMDMARQILSTSNKEMTAEEIRQAIVTTFGIQPASSMTQMLYKRSRAGSSFYKLDGGRYGLLEWRTTKQQQAA